MPEISRAVNEAANKDGSTILAAQGPQGMFNYSLKPADWDHSVSQYGVLGPWAGAQIGAEIPPAVWEKIDDAWRKSQGTDGGWGYGFGPPMGDNGAKPSMT